MRMCTDILWLTPAHSVHFLPLSFCCFLPLVAAFCLYLSLLLSVSLCCFLSLSAHLPIYLSLCLAHPLHILLSSDWPLPLPGLFVCVVLHSVRHMPGIEVFPLFTCSPLSFSCPPLLSFMLLPVPVLAPLFSFGLPLTVCLSVHPFFPLSVHPFVCVCLLALIMYLRHGDI